MKKYSGYSLVELMVALVVLGILMSVGVPKMLVFFEGNRMVANANDLLAGLHIARSEAIKTGFRVSICKSKNADTAAPTCDTAATWDQGWFVYEEGKNAGNVIGAYDKNSDGAILRVNTGVEGDDVTITTDSSSIADYVSFTSRGVPKLSGGVSQSGVFRICDSRGMTNAAGNVVARGVVLGVSGRARTTNDATKIGACL
ncbi:MAG: GspH/FimT family pseudopilin [Gammaproteobacteria bacterium]|nr:GspH/FimT family pseudopilin [Gammaproteobacteria bacterium]